MNCVTASSRLPGGRCPGGHLNNKVDSWRIEGYVPDASNLFPLPCTYFRRSVVPIRVTDQSHGQFRHRDPRRYGVVVDDGAGPTAIRGSSETVLCPHDSGARGSWMAAPHVNGKGELLHGRT